MILWSPSKNTYFLLGIWHHQPGNENLIIISIRAFNIPRNLKVAQLETKSTKTNTFLHPLLLKSPNFLFLSVLNKAYYFMQFFSHGQHPFFINWNRKINWQTRVHLEVCVIKFESIIKGRLIVYWLTFICFIWYLRVKKGIKFGCSSFQMLSMIKAVQFIVHLLILKSLCYLIFIKWSLFFIIKVFSANITLISSHSPNNYSFQIPQ